jgi:hypothetical protein
MRFGLGLFVPNLIEAHGSRRLLLGTQSALVTALSAPGLIAVS